MLLNCVVAGFVLFAVPVRAALVALENATFQQPWGGGGMSELC